MKLTIAAIVAVSAALVVGLPIVLSSAAVAQDPAVDALLKRLERMERDIGTLNGQVYREHLPAPGSPTPLPPAGATQSNPPETMIEKWSCNGGQIALTSRCSRDGRGGFRECSGQVKTRNFQADAAFIIDGIEGFMDLKRQWYWQPDGDGDYAYNYKIEKWGPGYTGNFYDFRGVALGERRKPSSSHDCSKADAAGAGSPGRSGISRTPNIRSNN